MIMMMMIRDGNGSVGHGSWVKNGSPFLDGSRGSWVTALDPLTHDYGITVQWLAKKLQTTAFFLFIVDIKKLLTHSISPIIIVGGLILTYDFLLSRPRGLSSTTMPRSLLVPSVGVMTHFHLR